MQHVSYRLIGRWTVLTAAICLLAAPAALADDVDLESTIDGTQATADPGDLVTYSVTYTNNGPGVPVSSAVNMDIPPGVPAPFAEITQDQVDAIEASLTDTLGNEVGLFFSSNCDSLLVQGQNDGQAVATPGTFSAEVEMPMAPATVGSFVVNSPANIEGDYDIAGLGSCFDANNNIDCDTLATCFGPPLSSVSPPVTAPLIVVDDGTADSSHGCNALVNDLTDAIAMIRRGTCEFGLKALNAEQAGADAVVIVNDRPGALSMGGGAFGQLVTIPVLLLFQDDGEAIMAELESGSGTANGTEGGISTNDVDMTSQAFHAGDSTDTDPMPENDADTFTTTMDFGGGGDPPVAFFEWSSLGLEVMFTDRSTNDPTSWLWDFGDGKTTSTMQNPTFTYAAAGTYTVSLTATNAAGSGQFSEDVMVTEGSGPTLDQLYFVSAAAFAAGAEGSFFETALELNNNNGAVAFYEMWWLPRGADNSDPMKSEMFTLSSGNSVRYDNVLSTVFGLEEGAIGAVAVYSDSPDLVINSRTANVPQAKQGGSFGQSIPGIHYMNMTATGETERIIFFSDNDIFRGNLGCQNGMAASLRIVASLYDAAGANLDTVNIDLQPWSNSQVNRVFRDFSPIDVAYVDVTTATADARFTCYGSVLDNETSDPTTILGE